MTIQALLQQIQQAQVRLYVTAGKLKAVLGGAALPEILHQQISVHKDELIQYLQDGTDPFHSEWLARLAAQPAAPLSFSQRRLWLEHRMTGSSLHYHIYVQDQWQEPLNLPGFLRALRQLLQRHQVLLSRYTEQNGEPVQHWHTDLQLPLQLRDWSALTAEQQQQAMAGLTAEESTRPFDLENDFMFRLHLIQLAERRLVLCFTLHHIVADAWSVPVLLGELRQLYAGALVPNLPPLPAPGLQYADFARWQHQWMQGQVLQQQLDYWLTELQGLPLTHQLPLDYNRPAQQTFQGLLYRQVLPAALVHRLKALCQQEQVTLFMLLHTAYIVLLARYSGQQDIVTGVPMSGRIRQEVEPLIGFFVNTVLLRLDLSQVQTFRQLLALNKQKVLAAHDYQQVPLDLLAEKLQLPRDPRQPALFQLAFQLLQADTLRPSSLQSPVAEQSDVMKSCSVKVDLELHLLHSESELALNWMFNKALFRPETIRRMADNMAVLLDSIVSELLDTAPAHHVHWGQLPLLHAQEQQRLLMDWNQPSTGYPDALVHRLFEAQVAAHPEQVALVCQGQELSYTQLNQQANQLARLIRPYLCGTEPRVGILLGRSVSLVVSVLAVLKAGAAYVPLDPDYPAQRLAYMTEASELCLLLTGNANNKGAADLPVINLDDTNFLQLLSTQLKDNLPVVAEQTTDRLLYIVFTSGSTGLPKGVLVGHASMVNYCYAETGYLSIRPGSRFLHVCSVSFDAGNGLLFSALLGGATLYLEKPELQLMQVLQGASISHAVLPAAVLAALPQQQLPALQVLAVGGEQLPPEVLKFWQQGRQLWNLYGPTETTVTAVCGALQADAPVNRIGRPLPNVRCYVLDSRQQLMPQGGTGELYIGGPGVARGYLHQPALTADKFVPDPFRHGQRLYRTGDRVRYLDSGELLFLGRVDNQIKIRGLRVDLSEIEQVLSQHPAVRAVCVGYPQLGAEPRLVAWIVLKHPCTAADWLVLSQQICLQAGERLPVFMLPAQLEQASSLPLTTNGKVDKTLLPLPVLVQQQRHLPANRVETQMLALWQQLLGTEQICVLQDFFSMGGHSLMAMKLLSQLQTQFGLTLTLSEFIQASSIRGLAQRLQQPAGTESVGQASVMLSENAGLPLLFVLLGLGLLPHRARPLAAALPQCRLCVLQLPPTAARCNLAQMIDVFAAEVNRHQPTGVVRILGHSLGGTLGFELAKTLEQQGRAVQLVLLECAFAELAARDSRAPQFNSDDSADARHWAALFRQQFELVLHYKPLGYLQGELSTILATEGLAGHPVMSRLHKLYQGLSTRPVYSQALAGDHLSVLAAPAVDALAGLLQNIYKLRSPALVCN